MKITIKGNEYEVGKMDAIKQFHVARRVAPVLLSLGESVSTILPSGGQLADADIMKMVSPMINVIAKMSDEDSQYVLSTCLSVCLRQSGGGWAKVYVNGGGMAFDDIDLHVMLQLSVAVIKENLENFMSALSIAM